MIPVPNTRYHILTREEGHYVARAKPNGGHLVIDGPYLTKYEAEVEARRRTNARRTVAA
jgi:hypothetical protein